MPFTFTDHLERIEQLLARHDAIVDRIESALLNVRNKPVTSVRDRSHFTRVFESCLYDTPGVSPELAKSERQLWSAHVAHGFEPTLNAGYARELDPAELIVRAYLTWERGRWPGRGGRLGYASSVFAAYLFHQVGLLSLRMWDEEPDLAPARLRRLQETFERLSRVSPVVFLRDVRWIVQSAQGPLTKGVAPYFVIADHIAGSFADDDRVEIHLAGAALAGGHLRSQLRYRAREADLPPDDVRVLATARNSNAMDMALLARDLTALLVAYLSACREKNPDRRARLGDAIIQGLSADPGLFLERLDLLEPYTMIEDVFLARDPRGGVGHSPSGHQHRKTMANYSALIREAAAHLVADARAMDMSSTYSPLSITYGFCADVFQNIVMASARQGARTNIPLDEMLSSHGALDDKRRQAEEWERLHEHQTGKEHFEHAREWGATVHARLVSALERRAAHPDAPDATSRSARIFVITRGEAAREDLASSAIQAQEHCLTSDVARAEATGATSFPKSDLAADRIEGRFLASVEDDGEWYAVSKVLLTMATGEGRDAVITDVPSDLVDILRLTCPTLVDVR